MSTTQRWPVESGTRLMHCALFLLVRTPVIFGLGFSVLPALLGMEQLLEGGFKSVLLVALVLGVFDVGVMLRLGLMRVGGIPNWRALGWRLENSASQVLLGVMGFCLCAAGLVLGLWAQGVLDIGSLLRTVADFSWSQRLCFIAIGVLGGALVEESFYRGYLQPALVSRFGLVFGVVATAIIFDLAHLNFQPAALISKFVSGLVFGALRGENRSLLAPAIAHALFWFVAGGV
jgi:membrane protease YdiL (CAAX protease family)